MGEMSSIKWMEKIPIHQEVDDKIFFFPIRESLISKIEK